MSILNTQVNWFHDYYNTAPAGTVTLLQWLQSKKLQQKVEAIRELPTKKDRDAAKGQLPAITPSGIFSARNSSSLVKHSGFICIDIDKNGNEEIENYSELKKELCKLKQVAYCGASVSGTGFFLLIPIKYPEKHKDHFAALKQQFWKWGIVIDNKCGNIDRLRGASFDPEAYYNHNAVPFAGLPNEGQAAKKHHYQQQQPTAQTTIDGTVFEQAKYYTETIHRNKLEPGGRHWYIFRIAEYLAAHGVNYADACQWIYANVLPADEINSNCISYPYQLQRVTQTQEPAKTSPTENPEPEPPPHEFLDAKKREPEPATPKGYPAAWDEPAQTLRILTPQAQPEPQQTEPLNLHWFVDEAHKWFARSMIKEPARYYPAFIQSYRPTLRRLGIDENALRAALNL